MAAPIRAFSKSTQITDRGIEVADGTNSRVQLGDISAAKNGSSYGLKVISSDGSTVIIDGSSDMFRIAATGTHSKATVDGNYGVSDVVTLSGLGPLTNGLVVMGFLSSTNTAGSNRHLSILMDVFNLHDLFAATTSGGSPNFAFPGIYTMSEVHGALDGSNFQTVTLSCNNKAAQAVTFYDRYYVLAQTAI